MIDDKNLEGKNEAAIKTLERLGYTYHGGEQWKPPVGRVPEWLDDPIGPASLPVRLLEVTQAAFQWIDAVPQSVQLPTMPGFDRDWANEVIELAKKRYQK